MIYVANVIVVDRLCAVYQLLKVFDVLFDDASDIREFGQLVTLVLTEHASCTDVFMAHLAEKLNLLVLMLETENFSFRVHPCLV